MRRATIADVARAAGVSVATVSRIVNGQVSRFAPETVERVRAASAALAYRPAEAGRALRTQQSRIVALLVPDAANEFCAAVAGSLETALRPLGLAMMLCNTGDEAGRQDDYLAAMRSHGARAIVLLGAVDSPGLRGLLAQRFPLVFVNRRPPKGMQGHFVGVDDYAAGRAIADELVRRGRRHCAALHGPRSSTTSASRLQGFLDRLEEHGLAVPPERLRETRLTIEEGYRQAVALLDGGQPPDAIFCGNDLIAYGAHRRCRELGLEVPADLLLFGFDDNPRNPWLAPWLSTVHVPVEQFGPAIAELIDGMAARRERGEVSNLLLPFALVVRGLEPDPIARPPARQRSPKKGPTAFKPSARGGA
jgi:LacI family transcriptional regulator